MELGEFEKLVAIELFWVEGNLEAFAVDTDNHVENLGPTQYRPEPT
jgi:hypothetical protein